MAECPGLHVLAAMRDGLLARIRLPGGSLVAGQLRWLADAVERSGGTLEVTHRGNFQVRGLSAATANTLRNAVTGAGLASAAPWADRLRNILAAPLRGLDPAEVLDVGPTLAALDRALQTRQSLQDLSPKFSFALDGGGCWSVHGMGHDAGLRAELYDGTPVLRLSVAGAPTRYGVAPDQGIDALLAAALACAGASDRRMADLLALTGLQGVIRGIEAALGTGLIELPPAGPASDHAPPLGPLRQRQSGRVALILGLAAQQLDIGMARSLAVLTERFGSGVLRVGPMHAVVVADVATRNADAALSAAADLGLLTDPAAGRIRITACSGSQGCERGRADTRADARRLRLALAAANPGDTRLAVHVSGCPKGCAHPGPSDILLLARADGRGYDLHARTAAREADGRQPLRVALPTGEAAVAALAIGAQSRHKAG